MNLRSALSRLFVLRALLLGGTVPGWTHSLTVTHWGAAFYGAPYAVALEKGVFKAPAVDITGILTANGGTAVRNTLVSDRSFGEVTLPAAMQAINAGQPLVVLEA